VIKIHKNYRCTEYYDNFVDKPVGKFNYVIGYAHSKRKEKEKREVNRI
jgi:hypothetical protein